MKELDSNSIISRIKAGDISCLEDLVVAYKSYCINGLCRKTKCTADDAEDLFVDAILELRDRINSGKLEHLLNVKSYIFGICYNKWLTHERLKSKPYEQIEEIANYYTDYINEDQLFSKDNKDYQMQLLNAANEALENLSSKCRQLIKYFYLDRLSMDVIAETMGFANSNVAKTTKSRCFKKLVEKANELNKLNNV